MREVHLCSRHHWLVKATDGHVRGLGKELLGMKPDEWRRTQ